MKMMNPFPPQIRTIGVAAPAGPADRDKYETSVKLLESFGLRVVSAPHLFPDSPHAAYLSANEEERAEDFNALIRNPEIDLIQCIRGGYGSPKILDRIDWRTLRERSLPVVGFSDITAIHLGMLANRAGIPVAGQMTARFAEAMNDPVTRQSFRQTLHALLGGEREPIIQTLSVWKEGVCTGPIVPANLTLLASLCGTPFLPDLTGAILVLEDICEPVRKLDRELTQLRLCGILKRLSGLIFAQFTDCGTPGEQNELFAEFAQSIDGPVLSGLEFGHALPSLTLPCGTDASIRGTVLKIF